MSDRALIEGGGKVSKTWRAGGRECREGEEHDDNRLHRTPAPGGIGKIPVQPSDRIVARALY